MVVLKKHVDGDYEYLDPYDLWDESGDPKTYRIFQIAQCVSEVLNYYLDHTPDAFGDAEYKRMLGYMEGYMAGARMDIKRHDVYWDIVKGKRIVLRAEVPKKPESYYRGLAENAELLHRVFG